MLFRNEWIRRAAPFTLFLLLAVAVLWNSTGRTGKAAVEEGEKADTPLLILTDEDTGWEIVVNMEHVLYIRTDEDNEGSELIVGSGRGAVHEVDVRQTPLEIAVELGARDVDVRVR